MSDHSSLLQKKTTLHKHFITVTLLLTCFNCFAQREINRPEHDDLPYYFGLTFGYASMGLHTSKSSRFLQNDSVLTVEPGTSGGVALGLLATKRLFPHFELRFAPQLIIGGAKYFTYTLKYPNALEADTVKKTLPSTLLALPLQIKFNSDRIDNFRVYLVGGANYQYDLASNSNQRNADDLVKLKKSDLGLEAGIGFNFYLKFVTVSPELKFNAGLSNIHDRNPDLKYSSVLGSLRSNMIMFSLNLEH